MKEELKAGDRVRITRGPDENDPIWGDEWVGEMDKSIGEEAVIRSVVLTLNMVYFEHDNNDWSNCAYPTFVLEKVTGPPKFKKVVLGDKETLVVGQAVLQNYSLAAERGVEKIAILFDFQGGYRYVSGGTILNDSEESLDKLVEGLIIKGWKVLAFEKSKEMYEFLGQ